LKLWLEDVNLFLAKQQTGEAKQRWRAAGERKVYIVLELCYSEMDKLMFNSPLMKSLGDQVTVTVTELLTYEQFANNTNETISCEKRYNKIDPVTCEGLYFWAEFNVGFTGHTMDDLLRIWSEEADAAIGAKSHGVILDLWKCVGMRRVHALLNFDNIEKLDKMSFDLPIMKKNGENVDLKIKPVVRFETLAEHLTKGICS